MKHVIFGGDGFVGRYLARDLDCARRESALWRMCRKSDLPHYAKAKFAHCDVTDVSQVYAVDIKADDMVYNLSAKMLSPLQVRAKRYDFFWPVNYFGAGHIMNAVDRAGAGKLVQFTTDMIYGHTVSRPAAG